METIKDNDNLNPVIEFKGKKYKCENKEKFKRVIYGMDDSGNPRVPGVGENAKPEMILAVYDRIGGFIKNEDGFKVINGAFCNFRASRNKPVSETVLNEKLEIILEASVNGIVYEWKEGDKVPWGEIVMKPEKKRGEKNKRVRVTKAKEEPAKAKEDEEPAKVKEDEEPVKVKEDEEPVKVKEDEEPAKVKEDEEPAKVKEDEEPVKPNKKEDN